CYGLCRRQSRLDDTLHLGSTTDEPPPGRGRAEVVDAAQAAPGDERYAVDIAPDGERAQALAETARYDAIILDLMIPKKDGMEVCRWLRQNRIQTPVIMLTARNQIHDRVAGLDAGADDYLPKPFAFEELLARLRALMRREQKNGHANRLQVADLVLDLKTHQVRRGETPIELTAREFALLEFLMRHPNQVLTQAQIAER